jgi:hypothetical protein
METNEAVRQIVESGGSTWMRILVPPIPPPSSYAGHEAPERDWAEQLVEGPWDRFVGILKKHKVAGPRMLQDLLVLAEAEGAMLRQQYAFKTDEMREANELEAFDPPLEPEEEAEAEEERLLHRAVLGAERRAILQQAEVVAFYCSLIRNIVWRFLAYGESRLWAELPEAEQGAVLMVPRSRPSPWGIYVAKILVKAIEEDEQAGIPSRSLKKVLSRAVVLVRETSNKTVSPDGLVKAVQRAAQGAGLEWPSITPGQSKPEAFADKAEVIRRLAEGNYPGADRGF